MEEYSKIDGIVEKNVERFSVIKSVIDNVDLRDLGLSIYSARYKRVKGVYCAVDGSKNVQNLGDAYLLVAKAVKVVGEVTSDKRIINRDPVFAVEIEDDYMGEDTVNYDSIRLMISLETRLIKECEDCDFVLLDGPIIDPPVIDDRGGKSSIPSLRELAETRARYIRELLERGKIVIGVVKRFSERFLVSLLKEKGYLKDVEYKEKMVVDSLLSRFASDDIVGLGVVEWDKLNASVSEIDKLMKAYDVYKGVGGFRVSSIYVKASKLSVPSRVDIAYLSDYDVEKVLSILSTFASRDRAEVSILLVLADELSTVSNQDVARFKDYYVQRMVERLRDDVYLLSNFLLRKRI